MTTAERDLVEALRSEEAGLAGAFEPRRRAIARLTLRLGRGRVGGKAPGVQSPAPGTMLPVPDPTLPAPADASHPPNATSLAPVPFDWPRAAEHCRVAYLRGRFLAHGSLSLACLLYTS